MTINTPDHQAMSELSYLGGFTLVWHTYRTFSRMENDAPVNFRTTFSIQIGWATLFRSTWDSPSDTRKKQVRLPENDGLAERMRRRNVEFEMRYGNHRHTMKALETLTGAAYVLLLQFQRSLSLPVGEQTLRSPLLVQLSNFYLKNPTV